MSQIRRDRKRMSDTQKYTVGWICAISTEYVAAQAFLDEKHEAPECVSINDNNDYTLGRVGQHNVVIAVAPDGEYGTQSAAAVARDMMHSFHNVRIGLMVGIAGGVPSSRHDIRLGDIVVSAPRDGKGGVFQYDFGKERQDQAFQSTGFLNQPPPLLRTAVAGLRAQYMIDGHQLEEAITAALDKKPRLKKNYSRPDLSSDQLFSSEFVHSQNDKGSCLGACGLDASNIVFRQPRDEDEDNPSVHYGLIASANRVINDALVRDAAAASGVLCFEMESAGLMNHFPCLVIRGICDYSDSHKNKQWQGYAAMAAAAYARDILRRIPPNNIEAEQPIAQAISNIRTDVTQILHLHRNQVDKAILEWLTPVEYHSRLNDLISKRQPGTGEWLLNSEGFKTWLNTSKMTLFCPGIPGAGKTFLTSIVIEALYERYQGDETIGIAYIYFDFRRREEQKMSVLLASLLKQMCRGLALPKCVGKLYDKHKARETRPRQAELSEALRSVVSEFSRCFILIDALDECHADSDIRDQFLSEIFSIQVESGLNLFATSRFISEISDQFEKGLVLEITAHEEDVQRYLDHHMTKLRPFVLLNVDLQHEIKNEITRIIGGMFLLARLHLESLAGKTSPKALRIALSQFSKGSHTLDNAYELAMERIEGQIDDLATLAKQTLSWIAYAKRPLTTLELRHALAVEVGETSLVDSNMSHVEDVVSVCAGLITVDYKSDTISFVHYTTQQYFERTRNYWFPSSEASITDICITYLSFSIFDNKFYENVDQVGKRVESNPFYDYAVRNWGHHARSASTPVQSVMQFLNNNTLFKSSSQALIVLERHRQLPYKDGPAYMTGLHLAAYFGIQEVVNALLSCGHDPDSADSVGRTPLSWAAGNGHKGVVELLLKQQGVKPDSVALTAQTASRFYDRKGSGQTPLSYAAKNGHREVVKLLLDHIDVNPNYGAKARGDKNYGRTPLSFAAGYGHKEVVELLLSRTGVEPDSSASGSQRGGSGRTPLSYAAEYGHTSIVKILLAQPGVDPDSETTSERVGGRTPLSYAAEGGHQAVVELLLAQPLVNPLSMATGENDYQNREWNIGTPLSLAQKRGHESIVRLIQSALPSRV